MTTKTILAAATAVLLAACGGSGTGSVSGPTTYQELAASAKLATNQAKNYDFTPVENYPKGKATFIGPMAVFEVRGATIDPTKELQLGDATYLAVGEANYEVDFAKSALTGEVDNFYEMPLNGKTPTTTNLGSFTGRSISGQMTIHDGKGSLRGALTKKNGERAAFDLELVDSDLLGPNGELLVPIGSGGSSADGRANVAAGNFGLLLKN